MTTEVSQTGVTGTRNETAEHKLAARFSISVHLPGIVYPVCRGSCPIEHYKISHAGTIAAGNESMALLMLVSESPTTCPLLLRPYAVLRSPPSVPRSAMPVALGPVMKVRVAPLDVPKPPTICPAWGCGNFRDQSSLHHWGL